MEGIIQKKKSLNSVKTNDSFDYETNNILNNITNIYENLYLKASKIKSEYTKMFNLPNLKKICFKDYLERIFICLDYNENIWIISLIYMDLILKRNKNLFNKNLLFLLIIVTIKLAQKYYLDTQLEPFIFNKIIGVNYQKLLNLEKYISNLIDWKFYVSDNEFNRYFKKLNN